MLGVITRVEHGLTGEALANHLQYCLEFNIILVVGLQLGSNAVERALQSLLGGGIHHLGLA